MKRFFLSILLIVLAFTMLNVQTSKAILDNKGKDFIMAFLVNYPYYAVTDYNIELHLTSDVACSVQVDYPYNSPTFTTTVGVIPGSVTIVTIPYNASLDWVEDVAQNNCVRAFSTSEFVCYMINRAPYTSDAALALPVETMNTEYLACTYSAVTTWGDSQINVYAAYDNTTVTITPTVDLTTGGHLAGVPFNVVLNKGEGYYNTGLLDGAAGDLTGTIITSDKPVGLTNGNKCANIPLGYGACDHVFEVAQPIVSWGKTIGIENLPNRPNGSIYRIIASENTTSVDIDGINVALLNKGQFYETAVMSGNHLIEGDKPIFVVQFMTGQSYPGSILGDPAMGNIPPFDQYLNNYTFSTVGGGQFLEDYVTIICLTSEAGSTMLLDAAVIPAGDFTPIGSTLYSSTVQLISSGVHTTSSTNGHSITVEGFNDYDSYIYPGGALFQFINPHGDPYPPQCQLVYNGNQADGSATDNTPSEDNNPADGILDPGEDLNNNGVIDEDQGIYFVDLDPGSVNLTLTVTPFTPGDGMVWYTVTLTNPLLSGNGTVIVTDGAGNTCSSLVEINVQTGPPQEGDLVLWLDGDQVPQANATPVSVWDDQTTPQNDAVQSVNTRRPTYYDNVINGHDVVEFDPGSFFGDGDVLTIPWAPEFLTGTATSPSTTPKTLSVVFNVDCPGEYNTEVYENSCIPSDAMILLEFGGSNSGYNIYLYNQRLYFGMWRANFSKFIQGPVVMPGTHIAQLEYTGNNILEGGKFRGILDGSQVGSTTFSGLMSQTSPSAVGGAASGTRIWLPPAPIQNYGNTYGRHFDGAIAEVTLYNIWDRTIGTGVSALVYEYLRNKYTPAGPNYPNIAPKENNDAGYSENNDFAESYISNIHPNPFSTKTSFDIKISEGQNVVIELYDALGQKVGLLFNSYMQGGNERRIDIDGSLLSAGVYVIKVQGELFFETAKIVLAR